MFQATLLIFLLVKVTSVMLENCIMDVNSNITRYNTLLNHKNC